MDDFTTAFFECALWSSTDNSRDDGGDPLDKNYGIEDIDPTCLAGLTAECEAFQRENAEHMVGCTRYHHHSDGEDCVFAAACQGGHDFWLTRNGHGAGFWDGDWPEPAGEILTKASKAYGGVDLYIGDDGKVYASGYEK